MGGGLLKFQRPGRGVRPDPRALFVRHYLTVLRFFLSNTPCKFIFFMNFRITKNKSGRTRAGPKQPPGSGRTPLQVFEDVNLFFAIKIPKMPKIT